MWQSKKICCMAKSTMTVKTLAVVDAPEASSSPSNLISELFSNNQYVKILLPIDCFSDSRQLYSFLRLIHPVHYKRLRVEIGILQEMIEKKGNSFCQLDNSDKQIANCLTKCGLLLKVLSCGKI